MKLLPFPESTAIDERAKFAVFSEACRILEAEKIPYVMGGGVAVRAYGRVRELKDADLFMQRQEVFKAMDALTREGGFHTRDTDAVWLYKAIKHDVLVDIIVRTTGNILMTDETYARARWVELHGTRFRMMGPEDLIFRKIHSHREGRPDQFDALSMLQTLPPDFDWPYFLSLAQTNDLARILGFMLWSSTDVPPGKVPRWVLDDLKERVFDGGLLPRVA